MIDVKLVKRIASICAIFVLLSRLRGTRKCELITGLQQVRSWCEGNYIISVWHFIVILNNVNINKTKRNVKGCNAIRRNTVQIQTNLNSWTLTGCKCGKCFKNVEIKPWRKVNTEKSALGSTNLCRLKAYEYVKRSF